MTAANIGDSRLTFGVSSREGGALIAEPCTVDHKPDLPDEKARILAVGGRVFAVKYDDGIDGPGAKQWSAAGKIDGDKIVMDLSKPAPNNKDAADYAKHKKQNLAAALATFWPHCRRTSGWRSLLVVITPTTWLGSLPPSRHCEKSSALPAVSVTVPRMSNCGSGRMTACGSASWTAG